MALTKLGEEENQHDEWRNKGDNTTRKCTPVKIFIDFRVSVQIPQPVHHADHSLPPGATRVSLLTDSTGEGDDSTGNHLTSIDFGCANEDLSLIYFLGFSSAFPQFSFSSKLSKEKISRRRPGSTFLLRRRICIFDNYFWALYFCFVFLLLQIGFWFIDNICFHSFNVVGGCVCV